jgi:predicted ATP-binding protein involved in virulence
MDLFLQKISVNEVRHIKNLEIPINSKGKKHLLLTGKNGSGKTSILEALKNYLKGLENSQLSQVDNWINEEREITNRIQKRLIRRETEEMPEETILQNENEIRNLENRKKNLENRLRPFREVIPVFNSFSTVQIRHQSGDFIVAYFDSKRTSQFSNPDGIKKIDIKKVYNLDETANQIFIQHLVNLKADKSFARDDNDDKTIGHIDLWFEKFTDGLRDIFDEKKLDLQFDKKNYNFLLKLPDRNAVNFNTLSDGYSAILKIITEVMFRMESKSSRLYDLQGIVIIDEIETHLHVELQKKILPFLTTFFPRIQFIVSTHSSFVLSSIEDATIYDLEHKFHIEDLSGYSSEAIIESYFLSDKYSGVLKSKIERYTKLYSKKELKEEELSEFEYLRNYLRNLPKFLAPELQLLVQNLELKELTK